MDLYSTDTTFLPKTIIENYESLVWTDRYAACGDFSMVIPWSFSLAQDLKNYKYLIHSETNQIMMVETVNKDREGPTSKGTLVKITGRSLEAFLDFRSNKTFALQESEVVTGRRGQIANHFVNTTCVTSPVSGDNIPGLTLMTPPTTGLTVTLTVPRGPIYSMVKQILDADNLGFKLYRGVTAGELLWKVYEGVDWSGDVSPTLYREFSPDNDSLEDITSLESIANYKNHIIMIGDKASIQFFDGLSTSLVGLTRRTIVVDAHDIGPDTTTTIPEDQAALTLRSYEVHKMDENKYVQLVDGQVPPGHPFELGDIVWLQDSFGMKTLSRITEKIWTSDATGVKRIPTFEAM